MKLLDGGAMKLLDGGGPPIQLSGESSFALSSLVTDV